MKTVTKATWRSKGLFQPTLPGHSPSLRKVRAGAESKRTVRTEVETMEVCLLQHSLWLLDLLSRTPQDHLLSDAMAYIPK